jgi:glycosyltransferase involved in cell wall biosynthesis
LSRILRRLDPEVVHLHSSKAGLAGRLAVRGRRPTVFQPHLWSFRSAAAAVCVRWERFAGRWTSQLLCVSDDELADGVAAGVSAPAEVVCNGVDLTAFQPSSRSAARRALGLDADAPLAVCVGRLAWLKGQDQLLAAWPSIVERAPAARLALVGDGPLKQRWRAGAPDSVVWCGHSDRTADWYAAADVVVLPSRAEGMALVPLEAMACGRSVVAFDVGGVRQSVADAGTVVPAGDVAALADAVAARLADPGLAGWEGQLARATAEERFDERRMCDQVAVLTEKLV